MVRARMALLPGGAEAEAGVAGLDGTLTEGAEAGAKALEDEGADILSYSTSMIIHSETQVKPAVIVEYYSVSE